MLQLDNAGWHGEPILAVPDGLRLVYLPAHTPELQPAGTLWALHDETIVNTHADDIHTLERIIARRCCVLAGAPELIELRICFHWLPDKDSPS